MWVKAFLSVCLIVAIARIAQGKEARTVNTSHGSVRGYKAEDEDIFVFYGIPYATAPFGTLKFQGPLPPPLCLSTLEAVENSIICPQSQQFVGNKQIKEDCLVANIYVPNTKEKNLPVIVYVHGGAFFMGHGDQITPKKLVSSGKVIAVTFNYRLGPHGFLCLGTKHAPGNAGLKDQVALLQWVNMNIEAFGGNPKDVTLAGYSAGASSVELLMLSETTKDLFHKVIVDSASSHGPAVVMNPIENAKIYAKSLNFTNVDDIYALEEFYTSTSLEILTSSASMVSSDSTVIFAPCVERPVDGREILKDAPENIFKSGKFRRLPMLYGFSNMEGLFRLGDFDTFKVEMNKNFSAFLPANLQFENEEQREAVANRVKKFYFGDNQVSENNILKYIDFFGDALFIYPVLQAVKQNVDAGNENVYLYEYSFVDKNTTVVPHTDGVQGAKHCAQTFCVLDDEAENNVSDEMKEMKTLMREFWINFIKMGQPVPYYSDRPAWPPVESSRSPYMSLNLTPTLQQEIHPDRVQFWDEIYAKNARLPIPPPKPPTRHSEL